MRAGNQRSETVVTFVNMLQLHATEVLERLVSRF